MRYPSLSRSNMRYRGPMESRKLSKLQTDAYYDLSYLYQRLQELKQETETFIDETREGGMEMSSQFTSIRKHSSFLRGGDSRE